MGFYCRCTSCILQLKVISDVSMSKVRASQVSHSEIEHQLPDTIEGSIVGHFDIPSTGSPQFLGDIPLDIPFYILCFIYNIWYTHIYIYIHNTCVCLKLKDTKERWGNIEPWDSLAPKSPNKPGLPPCWLVPVSLDSYPHTKLPKPSCPNMLL